SLRVEEREQSPALDHCRRSASGASYFLLRGTCNEQLVLLFTNLLAIALARQRFLHALLFTWFQVERVTLDFLDNVFGLHLALKAPQGILKGFAFLNSN